MINLAVIGPGVNLRTSPTITAPVLFQTTALTFATVFGKSGPADGNGNQWLELKLEDGREAWARADVIRGLVGDFTLLGGGTLDTLRPANTIFTAVVTSAPVPAGGLWPAPMTYSAKTTDYNAATHPGVDLVAPLGTPVYSRARGVVVAAMDCPDCPGKTGSIPGTSNPRTSFGYGVNVIVRYARADVPASVRQQMDALRRSYLFVRFAHLSRLSVSAGETVEAGEEVGREGQSGNARGAHLHLETRLSNSAAPADLYNELPIDPALVFAL